MSSQKSSEKIFLVLGGKNRGPYSIQQIREMLTVGKIDLNVLCWRQHFTQPEPLRNQREFQTAKPNFHQGASFESERYPSGASNSSHVRQIALDIVLTIVTCGLFNLYVQYTQIQAINDMLREEKYSFLNWFLLSIVTCGLYHIYHEYRKGTDISMIVQGQSKDLNIICLALTLFGLSIVADAIQQGEINKYYGHTGL